MDVRFAIGFAVLAALGALPTAAQGQAARSQDQAAGPQHQASTGQTKAPDKGSKAGQATKPSDKICKRLSQGKVCMTAEKWKAYEEMY